MAMYLKFTISDKPGLSYIYGPGHRAEKEVSKKIILFLCEPFQKINVFWDQYVFAQSWQIQSFVERQHDRAG